MCAQVHGQLLRRLWTLSSPLAKHANAAARETFASAKAGGSHADTGAPVTDARRPPFVGMHVRRGDACRCLRSCCWSNADGPGRPCYAIDECARTPAQGCKGSRTPSHIRSPVAHRHTSNRPCVLACGAGMSTSPSPSRAPSACATSSLPPKMAPPWPPPPECSRRGG